MERLKNQFFKKRQHIVLLSIVLIAVLTRTLLASIQLIYPDSYLYLTLAKDLLKWEFTIEPFSKEIYPLYPALTAILSIIISNIELSAITVSIFSGSLLLIPVFLIADRFYERKTAWVSAAIVAFYPTLVEYSTEMLTGSLFTFLFVMTILYGWYAYERGKNHLYLLTGFLCGLSYLTRPVGITFIVNVAMWSIIAPVLFFRVKIKNAVVYMLISIFGFMLLFLPYASAYYAKRGYLHFQSISRLTNPSFKDYRERTMKIDILPGDKRGAEDSNTHSSTKDAQSLKIQTILTLLIKKISTNTYRYMGVMYVSLSYLLIPIIAGFLLRGSWNRGDLIKELYLFSWIPVYFLVPVMASEVVNLRKVSPILPILIVWLGRGIVVFAERLSRVLVKRSNRVVSSFVFLAVLVLIGSFSPQLKYLYKSRSPSQAYRYWSSGHKEMALWMRENLDISPRLTVWDRKPFSAYYLNGRWATLPHEIDENFIKRVKKSKDTNYVVIDSQIIRSLRPHLSFLISGKRYPKEFKLVYHRFFNNYKKRITVYEVVPDRELDIEKDVLDSGPAKGPFE